MRIYAAAAEDCEAVIGGSRHLSKLKLQPKGGCRKRFKVGVTQESIVFKGDFGQPQGIAPTKTDKTASWHLSKHELKMQPPCGDRYMKNTRNSKSCSFAQIRTRLFGVFQGMLVFRLFNEFWRMSLCSFVMRYLHSMVRVKDLDASLFFYCELLGLKEFRRHESEKGRFTLVFLGPQGCEDPPIELTYNWDSQDYGNARNFGHLAFGVENIYEICEKLQNGGVEINRPPRDGRMAFVLSPDNISIELLQIGESLDVIEPWKSMSNVGSW